MHLQQNSPIIWCNYHIKSCTIDLLDGCAAKSTHISGNSNFCRFWAIMTNPETLRNNVNLHILTLTLMWKLGIITNCLRDVKHRTKCTVFYIIMFKIWILNVSLQEWLLLSCIEIPPSHKKKHFCSSWLRISIKVTMFYTDAIHFDHYTIILMKILLNT